MIKMSFVSAACAIAVMGTSAAYAQTAPMSQSGGSMASMSGMNMPMQASSAPTAAKSKTMKHKMKKHKTAKAKMMKSTDMKPMGDMSKDSSMPMKP